jgi:hypothetical protein
LGLRAARYDPTRKVQRSEVEKPNAEREHFENPPGPLWERGGGRWLRYAHLFKKLIAVGNRSHNSINQFSGFQEVSFLIDPE